MGLLLIVLTILGETLDVHPCRGSANKDMKNVNGTNTTKGVYWDAPVKDKAMWAKWLEEYKSDPKNKKSSGQKDAGIEINDGRPGEWQGYGGGSGGVAPPPWAYTEGAHGKADLCFLEPEEGNCNKNETRWGYNSYNQVCTPFKYSGCGGNENNFVTKPRCDIACAIDVATNCQMFDDDDRPINI